MLGECLNAVKNEVFFYFSPYNSYIPYVPNIPNYKMPNKKLSDGANQGASKIKK